MKLKIILVMMLLGVKAVTYGQKEVFVSATNKGLDGYITVGALKNTWGLYVGAPYNDTNLANQKTGSITSNLKLGILKMLQPDKILIGAGIQPVNNENKINAFIGYNALKSSDLKLWIIGNLVGSNFSPGIGLSYKIK
jgi:hypothetical protein